MGNNHSKPTKEGGQAPEQGQEQEQQQEQHQQQEQQQTEVSIERPLLSICVPATQSCSVLTTPKGSLRRRWRTLPRSLRENRSTETPSQNDTDPRPASSRRRLREGTASLSRRFRPSRTLRSVAFQPPEPEGEVQPPEDGHEAQRQGSVEERGPAQQHVEQEQNPDPTPNVSMATGDSGNDAQPSGMDDHSWPRRENSAERDERLLQEHIRGTRELIHRILRRITESEIDLDAIAAQRTANAAPRDGYTRTNPFVYPGSQTENRRSPPLERFCIRGRSTSPSNPFLTPSSLADTLGGSTLGGRYAPRRSSRSPNRRPTQEPDSDADTLVPSTPQSNIENLDGARRGNAPDQELCSDHRGAGRESHESNFSRLRSFPRSNIHPLLGKNENETPAESFRNLQRAEGQGDGNTRSKESGKKKSKNYKNCDPESDQARRRDSGDDDDDDQQKHDSTQPPLGLQGLRQSNQQGSGSRNDGSQQPGDSRGRERPKPSGNKRADVEDVDRFALHLAGTHHDDVSVISWPAERSSLRSQERDQGKPLEDGRMGEASFRKMWGAQKQSAKALLAVAEELERILSCGEKYGAIPALGRNFAGHLQRRRATRKPGDKLAKTPELNNNWDIQCYHCRGGSEFRLKKGPRAPEGSSTEGLRPENLPALPTAPGGASSASSAELQLPTGRTSQPPDVATYQPHSDSQGQGSDLRPEEGPSQQASSPHRSQTPPRNATDHEEPASRESSSTRLRAELLDESTPIEPLPPPQERGPVAFPPIGSERGWDPGYMARAVEPQGPWLPGPIVGQSRCGNPARNRSSWYIPWAGSHPFPTPTESDTGLSMARPRPSSSVGNGSCLPGLPQRPSPLAPTCTGLGIPSFSSGSQGENVSSSAGQSQYSSASSPFHASTGTGSGGGNEESGSNEVIQPAPLPSIAITAASDTQSDERRGENLSSQEVEQTPSSAEGRLSVDRSGTGPARGRQENLSSEEVRQVPSSAAALPSRDPPGTGSGEVYGDNLPREESQPAAPLEPADAAITNEAGSDREHEENLSSQHSQTLASSEHPSSPQGSASGREEDPSQSGPHPSSGPSATEYGGVGESNEDPRPETVSEENLPPVTQPNPPAGPASTAQSGRKQKNKRKNRKSRSQQAGRVEGSVYTIGHGADGACDDPEQSSGAPELGSDDTAAESESEDCPADKTLAEGRRDENLAPHGSTPQRRVRSYCARVANRRGYLAPADATESSSRTSQRAGGEAQMGSHVKVTSRL